ncbi:ribbon-helix-helix domain-containing protein [Methylotuvimicrobium alcaliphilum]|uniref:Ribbon-helix-helix protein CopG domain-containing protein n=1 Tax=Methylotuvimicrobium alcaliphilum (strain DSM 19304 / NCIMB 14124 / VKM B-2133 / 20Z) TaxID=1091494 RepID=G4SYY6_META2|nr:ribbon-helix-helix domain-containing protein [Methylotuvimicrobium alcaliphilum]CCE25443.1 protein of unknown function [Methylotuvimicrobium alcaliphilum 20Z]
MRKPAKRLTKAQLKELKAVILSLNPNLALDAVITLSNQFEMWQAYQQRKYFLVREPIDFIEETVSIDFSALDDRQGQDEKSEVELVKVNKQAEPEKQSRRTRGKGNKPAKKVTSIAIDPDVYAKLELKAEAEQRSIGAIIRLAIGQYLENT